MHDLHPFISDVFVSAANGQAFGKYGPAIGIHVLNMGAGFPVSRKFLEEKAIK